MMVRPAHEANQHVRLKIEALAGLLVDLTKTNANEARAFVCLTRKDEPQCFSSASNPLTLAPSEKQRDRSRRVVRRHVAVWPELRDNTFLLENVSTVQLFELHIFLEEASGLSRPPQRIGICQWSLTASGTMNLIVIPDNTNQQHSSGYSIDRSGDAMLRVKVVLEDVNCNSCYFGNSSSSITMDRLSLNRSLVSLKHDLSPVQEEIVQAHHLTEIVQIATQTKDDAKSSLELNSLRLKKARQGGFPFSRRWLERRTKLPTRRKGKGPLKRPWWRKLTIRSKSKTDCGYHRWVDELRLDSADSEPVIASTDLYPSFVRDQSRSRKDLERNETMHFISADVGRPESPWDPFGIHKSSIDKTSTVESNACHDSQVPVSFPASATNVMTRSRLFSQTIADGDTLCYSLASGTEYLSQPDQPLSKNDYFSNDEVEMEFEPDPDLLVISDSESDDEIEVACDEDSDDEIEMRFETDSGILVVSDIREVDSPRGLASIFGCWDSPPEQYTEDAEEDEDPTVVFDSSSTESSLDHKPKKFKSFQIFPSLPVKKLEQLAGRRTPSPTVPSKSKTKMSRKKWAWIDSFSEGFTELLRCGPSTHENKRMRMKKVQDADANLLGIFVKRYEEDTPLQNLPEYRSPSSITMSDTVQW